jgi:hypothetical protein
METKSASASVRRCGAPPLPFPRPAYTALERPLTPTGTGGPHTHTRYRYVLKKYPFTADAADDLSKLVDPPASGTSELITVDGKQLLRKLWDEAMKLSQVRRRGSPAVQPLARNFGGCCGVRRLAD